MLLLCAWTSPSPDVVVYTLPGLRLAMTQIARDFRAASGVEVHVFAAPPAGLIGLIGHRARDDVVVADDPTVQALDGGYLLRPGAPVGLGEDAYVLIASARAAGAARQTVVTDPTTAATFDGRPLLAKIATLPAATMGVADTPYVVDAVAGATDRVGLVRASDAFRQPGVRVISVVPAAPARLEAALTANGQSGRAGDFLAYLAGPGGQAVLRAAGIRAAR